MFRRNGLQLESLPKGSLMILWKRKLPLIFRLQGTKGIIFILVSGNKAANDY